MHTRTRSAGFSLSILLLFSACIEQAAGKGDDPESISTNTDSAPGSQGRSDMEPTQEQPVDALPSPESLQLGEVVVIGSPEDSDAEDADGAFFRFARRLALSGPHLWFSSESTSLPNAYPLMHTYRGSAAEPTPIQRISRRKDRFDAYFGLDVSGNTGVVVIDGRGQRNSEGNIYCFENETWVLAQQLEPGVEIMDRPGHTSLDGDTLVVSGRQELSILSYEGGRWGSPQKFTSSDDFQEVAVSGELLAVTMGTNRGKVFAYRRTNDTWKQESLVLDGETANGHRIGSHIGTNGVDIAISSYRPERNDDETFDSCVFFYAKSSTVWDRTASFCGTATSAPDVSIHGNYALIAQGSSDASGVTLLGTLLHKNSQGRWEVHTEIRNDAAERSASCALSGGYVAFGSPTGKVAYVYPIKGDAQ